MSAPKASLSLAARLGHCGELCQQIDGWRGAEAAIGAGEDVFATDQFRVTDQSLGHQVRMLDEIGAMADDAGNQGGTLRQLHVLEHPPFVFMAWVGGFDRKASGIHPEDQVDDVPERDVIVMGAVVVAPTDMQANLFAGDATQGVIQCVNPQRVFAVVGQGDVGQAVPAVLQVRIVDLQQEAGIDDGLVFLMHGISDGQQERLVALVVFVQHPVLDGAWRIGRQVGGGHADAVKCSLEIVDVLGEFGVADIAKLAGADRHRWWPPGLLRGLAAK